MANNGSYAKVQAPVKNIHTNLDQDVIQITEDKLRLILNQHLDQIEQKQAWIAPLGVFLTIVLTLTTASFKDAFLSASVWDAIFIVSAILSIAWLIKTSYRAFNSPSVDDVVEKIKNRTV
jgi:hypothetical protein